MNRDLHANPPGFRHGVCCLVISSEKLLPIGWLTRPRRIRGGIVGSAAGAIGDHIVMGHRGMTVLFASIATGGGCGFGGRITISPPNAADLKTWTV
jgi:hypothetical protein